MSSDILKDARRMARRFGEAVDAVGLEYGESEDGAVSWYTYGGEQITRTDDPTAQPENLSDPVTVRSAEGMRDWPTFLAYLEDAYGAPLF